MEDSFSFRREKVFASLGSSTTSSPMQARQSSPWSVTDGEVERREWRRSSVLDDSDRDKTPCSSSFLEDEWGIKASIGRDPTLDYEEEEDEYDKVAAGTEVDHDHLFMREVINHGSYLNSHNVLHGSKKDSGANWVTSKLGLKEDDAKVRKLNPTPAPASASQVKKQLVKSPEDGGQRLPKSILKRTGDISVTKAKKRVRFDPSCVFHCGSEESSQKVGEFDMDSSNNVNGVVSGKSSRRRVPPPLPKRKDRRPVPDYLVNPSKYTSYSLYNTKVAEVSNTWASKNSNSESKPEMEDALAQLPKSVTFIPRKRRGDGNSVNGDITMKQDKEDNTKKSSNQAGILVGIAAVEVQSEVSSVEDDGLAPNAADSNDCLMKPDSSACLKKPGRKYRSKPKVIESDS